MTEFLTRLALRAQIRPTETRGNNTRTEQEETFELYKKAAKQGDAKAQYNLGLLYYDGIGTAQNFKKAFEWFKKAAEQGYTPAQEYLGSMCFNGRGTTENYQKACEWWGKMERGPIEIQIHIEYA